MTGVSCAGLAMVLGLNEAALLEIQSSGERAWIPPTSLPTVAQPAVEVERNIRVDNEFAFRIGDSGRNVTQSRVNIRQSPGHLGKPENDVIAQAQPGDVFAITDGPEESDNLRWWRIRFTTTAGTVIEGWMAEATASGVTIMGR